MHSIDSSVAISEDPQATAGAERLRMDQLRAILDHASVGIIITRSGQFELLGSHACRMLGYTEAELMGRSSRVIQESEEASNAFGARVAKAFCENGHFDGENLLRRKDGSLFWAHLLARGVVAGDPAGGTIWIVEDITDAKAAREQLSWSATHDSLTQLANRREFETRLAHAMTHFLGKKLCVMYIDLDRFKSINDTAGHAVGDEVLRQISHLMEEQVRQSDTVARLGGDEFAVLLPGCSLTRAQQLAEQIRSAVEHWSLLRNGASFTVGASIGVTAVTPAMTDIAAVLHLADSACYQAKRDGRNRVVTLEDGVDAGAELPKDPS